VSTGFRCVVIHVKHSVASCVAWYRDKKRDDPACRRCPIGAEHAAGREPATWPNGMPIERGIALVRHDTIPPRRRRRRRLPAA
jgi:hypothetical protein